MDLIKHIRKPWGGALALFAGVLMTLSFAPFNISLLAILSPLLLYLTWIEVSKRRAFLRGWLFGLGLFGSGASWIYVSLRVYGNANLFEAGGLTLIFVAVLALYFAVFGAIFIWLFPQHKLSRLLCVFPAFWVLSEILKGWLFSGFPWLDIGYSQVSSPLAGYAPILSVYGVSLVVVLCSSLLLAAIVNKGYVRIACLLGLLVVTGFGLLLKKIEWTHPEGESVKVSLIQGDIAQQAKWLPSNRLKIMEAYYQLTQANSDSQIVIWPENAIPVYEQQAKPFLDLLEQMALKHNMAILVGLPIYQDNYYNGAIVIGRGSGTYYKKHLVPFGEYVPFEDELNPILKKLNFPISDFSKGSDEQGPLYMQKLHVALNICYEIAFANLVRTSSTDAGLLVTISDDSWFGHSLGPIQHMQIAQMRAIETGKYLLRSTNTGITVIISPLGKVVKGAKRFTQAVLTGKITAMVGSTPWVRYGMIPLFMLIILLVIIGYLDREKND